MSERNRKKALVDELLSWPGVTAQSHRFGGTEFLFEGNEIGHLHGDNLVDMPLPKSMRDEMIAAGRAQPHHLFPESGWVSVYLKSDADIVNAVELLHLKYEHLMQKRNESFSGDKT